MGTVSALLCLCYLDTKQKTNDITIKPTSCYIIKTDVDKVHLGTYGITVGKASRKNLNTALISPGMMLVHQAEQGAQNQDGRLSQCFPVILAEFSWDLISLKQVDIQYVTMQIYSLQID